VVCFVEDDDLVRRTLEVPGVRLQLLVGVLRADLRRVLLDLLSHLVDASVVRRVEFEDSLAEEAFAESIEGVPEEFLGQGEDDGGFACSWWAVEQQVRRLGESRVLLRS